MLVLLLYILGKARLRGNQEEISKLIPTNQKAHKTGLKNKTQSELVSSTCDCWALSSIHDLFGFFFLQSILFVCSRVLEAACLFSSLLDALCCDEVDRWDLLGPLTVIRA